MSADEVERYYKSDEERKCKPTEYAKQNGVYVDNGNCIWWLRSPGSVIGSATRIGGDGRVYGGGDNTVVGVRPVLRINIQ